MTTAADARKTPAGNQLPFVTVVIETITACESPSPDPLASRIAKAHDALASQSYPKERRETIVVLDDKTQQDVSKFEHSLPGARIVFASEANYYAAKNAGAEHALGEIVVLLDFDCTPVPNWLSSLVSRFTPGVDVVCGRTRYAGRSIAARTFTVSDFGIVNAAQEKAQGIVLNNVAFRRNVLHEHPLDARARRNGACFLLAHELRSTGHGIAYEPDALVHHRLDVSGLGFVHKHFERGFDGTSIYRLDTEGVLRGSAIVRRYKAPGLVAIMGRRVADDWVRLARHRRLVGIAGWRVPYFCVVMALVRSIELAGGLTAMIRPNLPGMSPPTAPPAAPTTVHQ